MIFMTIIIVWQNFFEHNVWILEFINHRRSWKHGRFFGHFGRFWLEAQVGHTNANPTVSCSAEQLTVGFVDWPRPSFRCTGGVAFGRFCANLSSFLPILVWPRNVTYGPSFRSLWAGFGRACALQGYIWAFALHANPRVSQLFSLAGPTQINAGSL